QKKPPPITAKVIYQGASTISFSHIPILNPAIINLIFSCFSAKKTSTNYGEGYLSGCIYHFFFPYSNT
ncbi:MAG: hypothetical protein SWX82_00945, partial [Cyanobacteriota bacterium]|nr:hypothetical protein [Cyanobacteriota bacterium]